MNYLDPAQSSYDGWLDQYNLALLGSVTEGFPFEARAADVVIADLCRGDD